MHVIPMTVCVMSMQSAALWDLRNIKNKLHTFISHTDELMQVHAARVSLM